LPRRPRPVSTGPVPGCGSILRRPAGSGPRAARCRGPPPPGSPSRRRGREPPGWPFPPSCERTRQDSCRTAGPSGNGWFPGSATMGTVTPVRIGNIRAGAAACAGVELGATTRCASISTPGCRSCCSPRTHARRGAPRQRQLGSRKLARPPPEGGGRRRRRPGDGGTNAGAPMRATATGCAPGSQGREWRGRSVQTAGNPGRREAAARRPPSCCDRRSRPGRPGSREGAADP
jgi:hypothetical protein